MGRIDVTGTRQDAPRRSVTALVGAWLCPVSWRLSGPPLWAGRTASPRVVRTVVFAGGFVLSMAGVVYSMRTSPWTASAVVRNRCCAECRLGNGHRPGVRQSSQGAAPGAHHRWSRRTENEAASTPAQVLTRPLPAHTQVGVLAVSPAASRQPQPRRSLVGQVSADHEVPSILVGSMTTLLLRKRRCGCLLVRADVDQLGASALAAQHRSLQMSRSSATCRVVPHPRTSDRGSSVVDRFADLSLDPR